MGTWRNSSSLIVATRNITISRPVENIPDYQILTLKRKENAKSFASNWVFPGGVADKSDADPIWFDYIKSFGFGDTHFQKLSFSGTKLTPIFGEDPLKQHVSLRITAIRETFEELGLFLGRSQKTNVPSSWASNKTDFDVKEWQKKVHHDPTEFMRLCQHLNCYPDIWALHYWSNWLTPATYKTRFDTAFFVAGLENEPPIIEEESEVAEARWVNPLAIVKEKGVILKPPQLYEFLRLSSKPKLDELIQFATERSPHGTELLFGIMYKAKDGYVAVFPGDTLYPEDPHLITNTDIYQDQSMNELRRKCDNLHRMEEFKQQPRIVIKKYQPHHHINPDTELLIDQLLDQ